MAVEYELTYTCALTILYVNIYEHGNGAKF
jgi:hypothetical protein